MNVFSVDFSIAELQLLRQSLDVITITGRDAKIIATLQVKLETEIAACAAMIQEENAKKSQQLEEAVSADQKRKIAAK